MRKIKKEVIEMEQIQLWFQPSRRRLSSREDLSPASATHEGKLVRLCRQHFCDLCNLPEREKLRHFRGGNLEVRLTFHRTPSLWEERRFYLGHIVSARFVDQGRDIIGDEGFEFDPSRTNAVAYDFGEGVILVDPGVMGSFGAQHRLSQIIGERKLAATLVSHGHLDHWEALGESRGPVYMTRLAFKLASHHASIDGNDEMINALGRARMIMPGEPILMSALPVKIDTFSLPHSIPETMGFAIKGKRKRVIHLGDFRFNGFTSGPKFATINKLKQIAKEPVDVVALTIFNAHIEGFTPIEDTTTASLAGIIMESSGRVIITSFSTNLKRIERVAEYSELLDRWVRFEGAGMKTACQLIDFKTVIPYSSHKGVIFVTGCQAEEKSFLWRAANSEISLLELMPDDTLIFSSRCIPGNEERMRQLYAQLQPQVGRIVVNRGEVSRLGLQGLGLEEALTHVSGHENKEGLKLALEILRPKKVLAWPQVSPQIEAFQEICGELGIELLDESERVIEI